ncbi:MAG: DUF3536 domain-containing protein [Candidatus Tectomicrobia bacterium]|uniref:DUF3536 domain-containing protein n=1 Tax=Tectimicrobiota bacterium TaxID=2528274 RepID=A0A932CQZ5_UNCTE|nr:DUF3536 domain-containing protein [Candidatus Tectomicrobia bacterium]
MDRYVCIHGHFYQPPRENPWLEEVELQDSAYPYHDWNERISSECYGQNASSRILGPDRKIIDITNNYARMSFNMGPTLLYWMERRMPEAYRVILEADRESRKNFSGHGSAIAQAYNHIIMPLANDYDRRTQVIWGIRDFEHRFGRKPEGMWLPETAVDLKTLSVLAEHGIQFTILAPHQARRVRRIGDKNKDWHELNGGIDPKMPYLCRLPGKRSICLFFYDGPASHDVAFGGLLYNGEELANRILGTLSPDQEGPQLAHIATDGESYGHHHRHGDMALAYCLYSIEADERAKLTVYSEYLGKFPPTHEVEIIENSSWSCVHGIERWRENCGCQSGMHPGWSQAWRAPLREALDWLRHALSRPYKEVMSTYVRDPWQVRDDYIEVILDRSTENVERFLARHTVRDLSQQEKRDLLKLLEMQRHAMLMYTSCGWFFDEISGTETVQVMQYAARAMQLTKEVIGTDFEPAFIRLMEKAPSNLPTCGNGAKAYEMFVKPAVVDLLRVGAHYAISSLFEPYPEEAEPVQIYSYTATRQVYDLVEAGRQRLATGTAHIRSSITWDECTITFAILHLGDHNLNGGVREFQGEDSFGGMQQEVKEAFARSDIPEVIRIMDRHFGIYNYSLWHLFRDEQRKILNQILEAMLRDIEGSFRQIYDNCYPVMQAINELRAPLPKSLAMATEFILNTDLRRLLESEELDFDHMEKYVTEIQRWPIAMDQTTLAFVAGRKLNSLMESLAQAPQDVSILKTVESLLRIMEEKFMDNFMAQLDLSKAQNIYFSAGKQLCDQMEERASRGDPVAREWLEHFTRLGDYLHVRIT